MLTNGRTAIFIADTQVSEAPKINNLHERHRIMLFSYACFYSVSQNSSSVLLLWLKTSY